MNSDQMFNRIMAIVDGNDDEEVRHALERAMARYSLPERPETEIVEDTEDA